MPNASVSQMFPIFIVVWVTLGVASMAFFYLSKNASLKRKLWPRVSIGASVLFVAFVWAVAGTNELFFVVPFVGLITVLNLRMMKFCNSCGRTLTNQNPFSPPKFCSKCGASLEE